LSVCQFLQPKVSIYSYSYFYFLTFLFPPFS
jgi:hypothetical protein